MAVFTEHHAEADGEPVRYAEAGAGDPLLVLPGTPDPAPSPALALLADRHRVITIAGPAADSTGSASTGAARRAAALATALSLDSFGLVGTAAGSAAACWLAVTAPARVSALVLETPAAGDDLAAELARIQVPALILAGTRDDVSPPGQAAAYQPLLPNGFFSYVFDAGHDIQADQPETFAGLVADFLARRGRFLVRD